MRTKISEMSKPKLHSGLMEIAVSELIGYRQHTIVPNVYWGLYLQHECDLLVLDQNNRFTEVEIKVSLYDLKQDFKKPHGHSAKFISRLIYAVPIELEQKACELVPKDCGIITVRFDEHSKKFVASWLRQCRHKKNIAKPSDDIINKFYQLGCMRIWTLKKHLHKYF